MKTETLKELKKEIRKFHALLSNVSEYWGSTFPHYVTIQVVVQNMGADNSDCVDFNLEGSLEKLHKCLEVLKGFSEYYNSHVENWVYGELSMLVQGYEMSEYEEEYQKSIEFESGIYSVSLIPEE